MNLAFLRNVDALFTTKLLHWHKISVVGKIHVLAIIVNEDASMRFSFDFKELVAEATPTVLRFFSIY